MGKIGISLTADGAVAAQNAEITGITGKPLSLSEKDTGGGTRTRLDGRLPQKRGIAQTQRIVTPSKGTRDEEITIG